MPMFDYKCLKCSENFEELVRHPEDPVKCPVCSSPNTQKLVGAAAPHFKGNGFYITDYKNKPPKKKTNKKLVASRRSK